MPNILNLNVQLQGLVSDTLEDIQSAGTGRVTGLFIKKDKLYLKNNNSTLYII